MIDEIMIDDDMEQDRKALEAFLAEHPGWCPYCWGEGWQHDNSTGVWEDCPKCLGEGKCPRCGKELTWLEDNEIYCCPACNWNSGQEN